MINFAVTGANGFVGRNLCRELVDRGYSVRALVRTDNDIKILASETVKLPNFLPSNELDQALHGVEIVIHLAAKVHVMTGDAFNSLDEFREVNALGTESLAHAAARNQVKRFIYVSSIGVNGISTSIERPFSERDDVNPHNFYARSKWEGEQRLQHVSNETGLAMVIVRPPLVYGPNAPGNFAKLHKLLRIGIPLPFSSVKNLRSFIYVENLVDALILCATHPKAAGQTYLVSDREEISTPDLLKDLAEAMGRRVLLLPCSTSLLKILGKISKKSSQVDRLVDSLRIDTSKIRGELNWTPPYSLIKGLHVTVGTSTSADNETRN